jgi:choline kinase
LPAPTLLRQNPAAAVSLKVAILAAGRGTRLSPLTDERPKALVPVGDSSPLELLFATLASHRAISEVVLVVGHARDRIEEFLGARRFPFPVRRIFNPRYEAANNIESAALLSEIADDGFVLVNSDVILDPEIMGDVLSASSESFLVVDPTRPPRDEAMKVRYRSERLVAIGKQLDAATADGEYIGVARFDPEGARAFLLAIEDIVSRGGSQEWYEAAIGQAAAAVSIARRSTAGRAWIEIDDPGDLARAEREVLARLRPPRTTG